jgi:hypothetical protein
MKNLTEIKWFDVAPGATVNEAATEAFNFVQLNDCIAKFYFNGVEVEVDRFISVVEIMEQFYRKMTGDK